MQAKFRISTNDSLGFYAPKNLFIVMMNTSGNADESFAFALSAISNAVEADSISARMIDTVSIQII
ncbi:MAG TPA: hypothetical protein DEP23_16615 [Ruminococcaceae bacterium]|nr:hypothetical protein [Oscillospiraceae bacterium]